MEERESHPQRYELLERIAGGGMGEVYRARAAGAHGFEKVLAIKRILPRYAADKKFEERFIAEAKLAAQLTHANVVHVFDFGHLAGSMYIAMEFVNGPSLSALRREYHKRGRTLPIAAALHVALELCKGLDYAHQRGVVHRDISPANVLLSRAGEVKIADFGIARAVNRISLFRTGTIVGKWGYMSPEQTLGEGVNARSDLFAAGIVMHELFTGVRLFDGDDFETVTTQIRQCDVTPPSRVRQELPAGLDDIVLRCLHRDPARRFADANEVLDSLMEVCYGAKVLPRPRDVVQAIDAVLPQDPTDTAEHIGIDDAICAELMAAGVHETEIPSRATVLGTRKTKQGLPVEVPTAQRKVGNRTLTFVRRETALNGLAKWELIQAQALEAGTEASPPLTAERDAEPLTIEHDVEPMIMPIAEEHPTQRRGVWIGLAVVATVGVAAAAFFVLRTAGGTDTREAASDIEQPTRSVVASAPAPPDAATALPRVAASVDAGRVEAPVAPVVGDVPVVEADKTSDEPKKRRDPTKEKTRYGKIDIFVQPWADVYLRGRKIAEAPVRGLKLPYGKHRLKLVNPVQKRSKTITVTVPSKRAYRVTLPEAD